VYPRLQQRKRKLDLEGNHVLEGRLARVEAVLNVTNATYKMGFTGSARGPSHIEDFTTANLLHQENGTDIIQRPHDPNLDLGHPMPLTPGRAGLSDSPSNTFSTYYSSPRKVLCTGLTSFGGPMNATVASNGSPPKPEGYDVDPPNFYTPGERQDDKEECTVAPQKASPVNYATGEA
jgi:hypothetical protein